MFEQLTYKNHINEEISFGQNGIFVNENELHNYSWKYIAENNVISSFQRAIKKYSVPVVIACANEQDGINAINSLMECAEKDVLNKKPGKLIIGEYYMSCYITESKKSKYSGKKGFVKANLTVISDYPVWVKEITRSFNKSGSGESGKNLDYPHDFPYDFVSPSSVQTIINSGFAETDFRINIYGEVTNPVILVNGHSYAVNCYIAEGQYLTIDSKQKTIILTKANGETVNHFKDRDKDSYIFEKMGAGELAVSWSGDFGFDITLYEERSEPKWT